MLQGMKESYKKGGSGCILALSLAGGIARCRLKRRQGYRWAGLLSFEKTQNQDADSFLIGGRQHGCIAISRAGSRSCVVEEPAHAEKQHAREPGDLWSASPPQGNEAGPRRPKATRRTRTLWRSRTAPYYR